MTGGVPVPPKSGGPLAVEEAVAADAAEILQFLLLTADESGNLTHAAVDISTTVEEQADYLARQAQRRDAVTYCGKRDGRVVALAALHTPEAPRIAHTSEVSLLVAQHCWGQGIGSEMMKALLGFARRCGTLRLLYLGARGGNEAAFSLYRKFGFQNTGHLPGYFCIDGVPYDLVQMALVLTAGNIPND